MTVAVIVGKTGMSAGKRGILCLHLHPHTGICGFLTEFDGKTRRELHLNKLPEFIKVLEGCNHLQNIQQPETKQVVTDERGCTEIAST